MADVIPQARHGRIDSVGDVAKFDLLKFCNGKNPWSSDAFLSFGFTTDYYRGFVRRWGFVDKRRIADVGCAFGRWSVFLAEVNDHVCGFDFNESGVEIARKLSTHLGLDNTEFHFADAAKLPVEDGSFDGVWSFCALHLMDRDKTLREMHRILQPGGHLFGGAIIAERRVLEWFFEGYRAGGLSHRTTQTALSMLQAGPFGTGRPNFATADTLGDILRNFGFEVDKRVEFGRTLAPDLDLFAEERRDLTALGRRLANDAGFAEEFAKHPEIATAYPNNLDFRARRV